MHGPVSSDSVILLVEDEVFIRFDLADFLRDKGFGVIEAGNSKEALAALDSGARIDLVFSDIQMPGGMNGLALAAHILGHFPGLPVILTSGASLKMDMGAVADRIGPIEPKPYDPEAILARIHAALAARPPSA